MKSSEAKRKALDLVDDASEENATWSVYQSKTDVKILAQVIDEQVKRFLSILIHMRLVSMLTVYCHQICEHSTSMKSPMKLEMLNVLSLHLICVILIEVTALVLILQYLRDQSLIK